MESINSLDTFTDIKHNENHQGEALTPETPLPGDHKKRFYIESYGCATIFANS